MAAGDFNNDGFGDLAIGVPDEDAVILNTTVPNVGGFHILFGSGTGLVTANSIYVFGIHPPGQQGLAANARFGFAMAAFDAINGASDGKAELAVTAPGLSEWLFYSVTGPGTSTIVGGGFHGDGTRSWDSDRGR